MNFLPVEVLHGSKQTLNVSNHHEAQLNFLQVVQSDIQPLEKVKVAAKKKSCVREMISRTTCIHLEKMSIFHQFTLVQQLVINTNRITKFRSTTCILTNQHSISVIQILM